MVLLFAFFGLCYYGRKSECEEKDMNFKKTTIGIALLAFVSLGIGFTPVYAGEEVKLEGLRVQKERVERIGELAFVLLQEAQFKRRGDVVRAVRKLNNSIENIKKRVEVRIEEEKEKNIEFIKSANKPEELVNFFLNNPTLKNFERTCERSREVKLLVTGSNETLYDEWYMCQDYLRSEDNAEYIFTKPKEEHKIDLAGFDADEISEHKLAYNEKIEHIIENHNFYAFKKQSSRVFVGGKWIEIEVSGNNPREYIEPYLGSGRRNYLRILGITAPNEMIEELKDIFKKIQLEEEMREIQEKLDEMD